MCGEYLTIHDETCKNNHTGSLCICHASFYDKCYSPILGTGYCLSGHNGMKCTKYNCSQYLVNNICPQTNVLCICCEAIRKRSNKKTNKPIYSNHGVCSKIGTMHCKVCYEPMNNNYCVKGHDNRLCKEYFDSGIMCGKPLVYGKCPICSGSSTKPAIKNVNNSSTCT